VRVQDGRSSPWRAYTVAAEQALAAVAKTAKWEPLHIHPARMSLITCVSMLGGVRRTVCGGFVSRAKVLRQTYHLTMSSTRVEPRVALAEWQGGDLTIWNGTQNPFGVRSGVAEALGIPSERVRVIVPDFGAVRRQHMPISRSKPPDGKATASHLLRWTRQEEFTWAYFARRRDRH